MTWKLILGDCKDMLATLDDASIDACITSPPYFNLRDYAQWDSYEAYLADMFTVITQIYRVLKPGRHLGWNIQAYLPSKIDGERWHLPLSADTIGLAYRTGFMLESTIIWNKTNGRTQRMFGSYPYPPSIIYTPTTEDIHIFRKPGKAAYDKTDKSKITLQEWKEWTKHIWDMPVDYTKHGHKATFPVQLPYRFIRLHSLVGDVVLDPFIGSGTTGIACAKCERSLLGIEKNEQYYKLAHGRISAAMAQGVMI